MTDQEIDQVIQQAIDPSASHHARVALIPMLVAAIRAPQWQPIETAPRDGTTILLAREGQVVAGFWTNETYADGVYHWVFLNKTNPNVKFRVDGMVELNSLNALRGPTHWMPLGPPPTE